MAEQTPTRDAKLIQYLNEAYGKEKELEVALQAHIKMAGERKTYKKRLQDHLKETKAQARGLERRIKQLGGKAEASALPGPAAAVTTAASKAAAAAKGPVHALRGTGESEKQLKNAKDELWNEYEEIGNYTAIETLAESLSDKETAKLARDFRKQEERMANYLLKLIPTLTKAVVTEEVPAAERRAPRAATSARSRSARKPAASAGGAGRSRAASRPAAARKTRSASGTSRSGSSRTARSRSARASSG